MRKIFTFLSFLLCSYLFTAQAQLSTSYVKVNGHDFVDLGLPSGLKWATCNVGANVPESDGDYFAWGETEPKGNYNWNYKWGDGGTFTKYTSNGKTTLDAEDDAATYNWGKGCRMPTLDEFQELLDNCNRSWITMYGVSGYKFTSKTNGSFIFLPAAGGRVGNNLYDHEMYGRYWSSSLNLSSDYNAYYLDFGSGNCGWNSDNRYRGRSVRAVAE